MSECVDASPTSRAAGMFSNSEGQGHVGDYNCVSAVIHGVLPLPFSLSLTAGWTERLSLLCR